MNENVRPSPDLQSKRAQAAAAGRELLPDGSSTAVRTGGPLELPLVPYHALLDASAERFPDHDALRFDGRRVSFAALAQRTHRMARVIAQLGVRAGDRVALSYYDRPEYVAGFHALSRLGAIVVPLNPSLRQAEALHIVRDSGARLLLGCEAITERLEGAVERVVAPRELGMLLAAASTAPVHPVELDPAEDLLLLQYSSGTTGTPRGAMLTHRNLVASHLQYVHAGRVDATDISLVFVPLTHVYGTMLMGGALAAGATQVLMERFHLETSLELVQRHRVTLYYCTTAVVVELMRSPALGRFDLSSLRYINCGGAPLPDDVRRTARRRLGVRIANGYGLSEAPIVGDRVPGERRRIMAPDEPGRACGPDEPGEIQVRGPQVMRGYWNAPEATADAFEDGWLRTGDIGFHDAHGRLHVTARAKEMIKYNGFAVSPSELEGVLLEHPAVADCAVVGHAGPDGNESPTAYLVLNENGSATEAVEYVNQRVASYKRIRDVRVVGSLPRNAAGKVVKHLLA